MGNYHFTCAATGDKTKVEYTFGYKKNVDGKLRIFLHHSSVPYVSAGSPTVVANLISEEEVHKAQEAWASAIKQISKTYLEGGDYVAAAAEAAGELYGYGHSEVLFKPTKAAEAQFSAKCFRCHVLLRWERCGRRRPRRGLQNALNPKPLKPTPSEPEPRPCGGPPYPHEDSGFAINGGKGWSNVVFENLGKALTHFGLIRV